MSLDQLSKLGLLDRARAFSVLQQSLDVSCWRIDSISTVISPWVVVGLGPRSPKHARSHGSQVQSTL